MKERCQTLLALVIFSIFLSGWSEPDWRWDDSIPVNGRKNIYQYSEAELPQILRQGRLHALNYPVAVTAVLLPYEPMRRFLEEKDGNLLRDFLRSLFRGFRNINSFDDVQRWLGLHEYPQMETEEIPFKNNIRPEDRMGLTLIERQGATGFSISCAQCHAGDLFGQKILGLTNRLTRANQMFVDGKKGIQWVSGGQFQWATRATNEERQLFETSKNALRFVEGKIPVQRGLDTSLAQVSLSLSRRAKDPWATRNDKAANSPRKEMLRSFVADSKPAVWWNVKYKTRWLSDGSIVSGNPIFTNFLWNEIGRGTDLKQLQTWMQQNPQVIRALTSAVFASEAPSYFDFFQIQDFDLAAAKSGQQHFEQMCAKCHGTYLKGWQSEQADDLPLRKQLETIQVNYPQPTKVKNVGTDPNRYFGMKSLVQLNDLEISKLNGIRVVEQRGYVPPPLVGIWARWPYMHNNSIPTLCDVLKPHRDRPTQYYMGEAQDTKTDFDSVCNGYPNPAPRSWRKKEYLYSTTKPGSSNSGHDEGIFVKDGVSLISDQVRYEIVKFLQTL